jgi:catechol 2,3-dioxygenase-like lactoylglutathione lyase family enzyme
MLSKFPVHAILAATDIDRARAWYAERLGLEPIRERQGQLLFRFGPSILTVYQTSSAGTARNTVAEWHVDDLRAEMAALRARGLVFEEYDFGTAKTVDGIMVDPEDGSLNAWFTDSEGNVLGIVQGDPETTF